VLSQKLSANSAMTKSTKRHPMRGMRGGFCGGGVPRPSGPGSTRQPGGPSPRGGGCAVGGAGGRSAGGALLRERGSGITQAC
jgi:hypothetical protein